MPSSTASFTTPIASISPARASDADAPDRSQGIDHRPATLPKIYRQQGARQPGDIIPECRATSSRNQRATSSESAVNNTSGEIVLTTQPATDPPAVAMAGLQNGNVVVVHDTNAVIRCRIYAPDGTEVGPEVQLSQGPLATFPYVAVLKDGSFVAGWQENNGGTLQIVYRRVYGIFADGVVATPPVGRPQFIWWPFFRRWPSAPDHRAQRRWLPYRMAR